MYPVRSKSLSSPWNEVQITTRGCSERKWFFCQYFSPGGLLRNKQFKDLFSVKYLRIHPPSRKPHPISRLTHYSNWLSIFQWRCEFWVWSFLWTSKQLVSKGVTSTRYASHTSPRVMYFIVIQRDNTDTNPIPILGTNLHQNIPTFFITSPLLCSTILWLYQ